MPEAAPKNQSISLPYNWLPRSYQLPAWNALSGGIKRAALWWHRRAGKDDFSINFTATAAMDRVGTYWHMLPYYKQGRAVIWDGLTGGTSPRRYRDAFPKELIERERDDEMMLWLRNGSRWRVVGADNVDALVGTNPVGIVLSEFPLMAPDVYDYISPILAENGGWAIFIGTPRGKNFAYRLHMSALAEMESGRGRWFDQTLTVDDTHAIPEDELAEEKRRMDPALFAQEYLCSWSAPLEGAYYGKLMAEMDREKRITSVPYEPAKPVTTSWDLGMGDSTAIVFWQQVGHEVRAIDYYESMGQGMDHYAKVLSEKPYAYERHLAPHDINVREFSGQSRLKLAASHGIRFTIVPKLRVEDGISATRALLPKVWMDAVRCERLVQALREYSRERDVRTGEFRNTPSRTWATHAADAVRYFAVGIRPDRAHKPAIYPNISVV